MRIVLDARESGTSTGRYVDKLVEYLHKLKPADEIIVLTKAPRVEFMKAIAPDFKVVESNYKEFTFAEQFGLAGQIGKLKPDLVHFSMTQQPILYFGREVTTIHDLTTARYPNPAKNPLVYKLKQIIYRLVIHIVARKSNVVLTPSNFVKEAVAQYTHIRGDKIVVTYEAAEVITAKAEPFKELAPNSFLMYVGRPQSHKNLERLIEAFSSLKASNPSLRLVLAGKKDILYEQLEKKAKEKGVEGVIFTGLVSEAQLRWLYENTLAYVFPSLSEGFGLPGLEAMAHGAPVVASKATSLPEIYGDAAHYFDPYDASDMAAKIEAVLSDGSLREKLIKAGREQAAKYSWQKTAEQTLDVYKHVL